LIYLAWDSYRHRMTPDQVAVSTLGFIWLHRVSNKQPKLKVAPLYGSY
jgi:hypothetical protein